MFQIIFCAFGRHNRSRENAVWDGQEFWSRCTGCRTLMRRDYGGGWQKVRKEQRDAAPPGL